MLMGRTALIEGNSPAERIKRLAEGPLRLPLSLLVSNGVRATINRMLELDTKARFPSTQDAITTLESASVQTADPPEVYGLDDTEAPFVGQTLPRPVPRALSETAPAVTERPTRSARMAVAIVLLGIVASGAGIFLTRPEPPKPQVPARLTSEDLPLAKTPAEEEELEESNGLLGIIVRSASRRVDEALSGAFEATAGCRRKQPALTSKRLLPMSRETAPWVYVPEGYKPGRRHGVVLLLHDDDQTPEAFARQTKFAAIADRNDLVLIAFRDQGHLLQGYQSWDTPSDLVDAMAVFHEMDGLLCLDRSRVFAIGHGAGGRALEQLACQFPLAAIATTSTRGDAGSHAICPHYRELDEQLRLPPPPFLQISGRKDGYAPVEGGEACSAVGFDQIAKRRNKRSLAEKEQAWSKKNGCAEEKYVRKQPGGTCTEWHDCEARFVSCLVEGREWPGAPVPRTLKKSCVGPNNTFPFTQTIADFFLEI
jgi:poly(3-hydroxybutyrate) depolymerase